MARRRLEDKIAVISGASAGVGRAIARAFGDEGAKLALIARSDDGLRAAADEIRAAGSDALVLPLDVTDAEAVRAAADRVVETWGRIDIWVNDAMVSVFAPVDRITPDEYQRVIDVNYLGYVHGTLAALRHMKQRGDGVIIQIGSTLAYRSIPLQAAYCASKAAVRAFTESLRCELIHDRSNVQVTQLHLPAVNTPQFEVVRNKLPGHPCPVPPIYQPELVAEAAVRAALRPRREMWIGWNTVKAILGQRVLPGWLDRRLARTAYEQQTTDDLPPSHPTRHPDNLDRALPGDRGAHGPFDHHARASSSQQWMRRHARSFGLGSALVALAVGAGALVRATR